MPAVPNFLPSRNAILFRNNPWPAGTGIPIQIPGFPPILFDRTQAGFCGGMAFVTREIFEAGTPQLQGTHSELIPLPLAQYLMFRTADAFVPVMGQWVHVTTELDHSTLLGGPGLFAETVDACQQVTDEIDAGRLCPIGVVLSHSTFGETVFDNHVELVYSYERSGNTLTLHVYDCNSGGGTDPTVLDQDWISLDVSSKTPTKPIDTNATAIVGQPGRIRGFFVVPYTFQDPAPVYIDDAAAIQFSAPPAQMAHGESTASSVSVLNTGSTTWTPGVHHLASQLPLHNDRWGPTRDELVQPVRPQQWGRFDFTSTAPSTVGTATWAWQLARTPASSFGPLARATVLVGAQDPQCQRIRDEISAARQDLAALKVEKDSLNPRDTAELARIREILREMANLRERIVDLQHTGAIAGCAL